MLNKNWRFYFIVLSFSFLYKHILWSSFISSISFCIFWNSSYILFSVFLFITNLFKFDSISLSTSLKNVSIWLLYSVALSSKVWVMCWFTTSKFYLKFQALHFYLLKLCLNFLNLHLIYYFLLLLLILNQMSNLSVYDVQ